MMTDRASDGRAGNPVFAGDVADDGASGSALAASGIRRAGTSAIKSQRA